MIQEVSRPVLSVPFARPDIDDDDVASVVAVLRSGWLTTGQRVKEFEELFGRRVGAAHALALNSATAALHLALDAIGLQPGDEVIVPTMTFTASAEVVRYFDATPVLVDVCPDTLCIDPAAAERGITSRTRAIMPVHMAGHPAAMDTIMALSEAHKLIVIEDAAHAFPCTYRGRSVGTIGHMGAFSFYATKTITTGEGGMLVTDNAAFSERARIMSLHGMSRDAWKRYAGGTWRYDVVAPGFKYNLTDMAAALGLSQLGKADRLRQRRSDIARRYSEAFSLFPEFQVPEAQPDVEHAWHLYILRLNLDRLSQSRDWFLEQLGNRGVGTSVHFIPVHSFSYYRERYDYRDRDFPVACSEFARIMSLPIYPAMSDDDVAYVIETVIGVLDECRR